METIISGLATASVTAVTVLGVGLYGYCLYLAYLKSIGTVFLTAIFPIFSALYFIWDVWMSTGRIFHELTLAFLAFVALSILGVWLIKLEAAEQPEQLS